MTLPLDDDVAHVKWGGKWRMPTKEEIKELKNMCITTWTSIGGVYGRKVTGPNGNFIFLPAAGYFGSSLKSAGKGGCYWSSSLDTPGTSFVYILHFFSDSFFRNSSDRYSGRSVRAVFSR